MQVSSFAFIAAVTFGLASSAAFALPGTKGKAEAADKNPFEHTPVVVNE